MPGAVAHKRLFTVDIVTRRPVQAETRGGHTRLMGREGRSSRMPGAALAVAPHLQDMRVPMNVCLPSQIGAGLIQLPGASWRALGANARCGTRARWRPAASCRRGFAMLRRARTP